MNGVCEMEDITQYCDDELSLRVFNDEPLYNMRSDRAELFGTLAMLFNYTQLQMDILQINLAEDLHRE